MAIITDKKTFCKIIDDYIFYQAKKSLEKRNWKQDVKLSYPAYHQSSPSIMQALFISLIAEYHAQLNRYLKEVCPM